MRHFHPNNHRSELLAARARGLRLSPTLSEAKLWRELSAGRGLGVRHTPLDPVVSHRNAQLAACVVSSTDGCALRGASRVGPSLHAGLKVVVARPGRHRAA